MFIGMCSDTFSVEARTHVPQTLYPVVTFVDNEASGLSV